MRLDEDFSCNHDDRGLRENSQRVTHFCWRGLEDLSHPHCLRLWLSSIAEWPTIALRFEAEGMEFDRLYFKL